MRNAEYIIPALIILNETLKAYGMPKKFAPLINLIGGILFNFGFKRVSLQSFLEGILIGGAAGGLYDVKKLLK